MNAEIISVGTELLLGQTVNTDTTIVAKELAPIGVNLLFACTVGDNIERLRTAVKQALERSDILITTGGLGPTGDDLTKETVAEAAGVELCMHAPSMQRIEEYFRGRTDIVLTESQRKQAMLPQGCTVLQNDMGTAPGCAFQAANGTIVIMLPGPPSELTPMLKNYAIPYLLKDSNAVIHSENVHVFGRGEAIVAEMIEDLTEGENPTAATYAKTGEMFVRVTARAATEEQAKEMCAPVVQEICRRVGDYVYGIDTDTLENTVVQLLKKKGMRLATAESCTGGLLAKRITDIPGSSEVFEMGTVTYSNSIKTQLLDVPESLLQQYGAVSEQVACAMAQGVQKRSGSELGVGITGIAGPGGGTKEKPVGLVYIALSDGKTTWVRKMPGEGKVRSRESARIQAASNAFDMVRRYLCGIPRDDDKIL